MNFDCIYMIDMQVYRYPLQIRHYVLLSLTLGLLILQMFFKTPSVRYYCDIIHYRFLFVSVSVNMSLNPPYKIQSATPMAACKFFTAVLSTVVHKAKGGDFSPLDHSPFGCAYGCA